MTIRQPGSIARNVHNRVDFLPVAGFVAALAAGVLQAAWWFSHGWTWSNLPRFLMSGEPVAWCVILILAGTLLSWMGLRRTGYGQEGREWAVAGLVISAITAIPMMLGVLLIVVVLLSVSAFIGGDSRPHHERTTVQHHRQ